MNNPSGSYYEVSLQDGWLPEAQHEVDRGLYLWLWDSSWIEPAYVETLRALRDHVQNDT